MDYAVNFNAMFLLRRKGKIVAIDALEKVLRSQRAHKSAA